MPSRLAYATIAAITLAGAIPARAQGTAADYARANGLRAKYEGLVVNVPGPATWIDKTDRFWYRRMPNIALNVNGRAQTVNVDAATPLLYVLSDDLALNGPKFGCGLGQCGACTVIMAA